MVRDMYHLCKKENRGSINHNGTIRGSPYGQKSCDEVWERAVDRSGYEGKNIKTASPQDGQPLQAQNVT